MQSIQASINQYSIFNQYKLVFPDMAVQNFIGDAIRGATWVSLHNGGGVGWGDVINGGFGMLLDGSEVRWLDLLIYLLVWYQFYWDGQGLGRA